MTDINTWNATDDSNNAAAPAGWPEGMMPSGVNNAARAMMGSLKRWRDQSQPTVNAGGSANAQIITYPVAPADLVAGDVFAFFTAGANTGPVTLQVNAQAAKPVHTSIDTALIGGEIPVGAVIMVMYDGTNFRMLAAPTPLSIANGGTGSTTPGSAADAIGAVKDTGDVMTGTLTVPNISYGDGHTVAFGWDGANLHMYVDGSDVGVVGDIASVTAGNGLAGGGTTGALTISMSGSYSGNWGATGGITAGSMGCTGTVTAAQFTSTTGGVNVAGAISSASLTTGSISASGNVGGASLSSTGNASVTGTVTAGGVSASGNVSAGNVVYAAGGDTFMGTGASGRQLQMAGGWYWDFNPGNGNLIWGGPAGAQFWVTRYSDRYCGNQIGPVFGFGAYINSSDARGKTGIEPAAQGLAEVLRLQPKTFKRTGRDRTELGFTAQDVQQILPEAVWPLVDGAGADRLGVSLDPIVASLVNAVQALAARIEQLETALVR